MRDKLTATALRGSGFWLGARRRRVLEAPAAREALPADVTSIMFLQRMPRTDTGNVFDYTSYVPGGRLVTLTPPSADGKLTVLTSDPMFANGGHHVVRPVVRRQVGGLLGASSAAATTTTSIR